MNCIKCKEKSTHSIKVEYENIDLIYTCDNCFKEVKKDFNMAFIHYDSGDMLFVRKIHKKYGIGDFNRSNQNCGPEIEELEQFFSGKTLFPEKIKLDLCTTIHNVQLFLDSHFNIIKNTNGNKYSLPYLDRLKKLKNILENEKY
jgi:hypothetical protein